MKKLSTFSLAEALKFGFQKTIDNFALILALLATIIFVYILRFGGIVLVVGVHVIQSLVYQQPHAASLETFNDIFNLKILLGALIAYVIFKLVDGIIAMGVTKITLDIYDHDASHYARIFSCINLAFQHFFASLLYICMVSLGLLLFIVPGIYLAITYAFYQQAMVDKRLGTLASLRYSAQITKQVKGELFGFFLVIIFLNVLASSFFGVGLLITIPIMWLSTSYVYRKLQEDKGL